MPSNTEANRRADIGALETPEVLSAAVARHKENPTNPQNVTNFWREYIDDLSRALTKISSAEIPPCGLTGEELEVLKNEEKMMAYNPGFSYEELAKIFLDFDPRKLTARPLEDHYQWIGWVVIESSIQAPNRSTTTEELEERLTAQGKKGQRLSTYLLASHASEILTGKPFDKGESYTYSRLLGTDYDVSGASWAEGYVYSTSREENWLEHECNSGVKCPEYVAPKGWSDSLGGRSEEFKETSS